MRMETTIASDTLPTRAGRVLQRLSLGLLTPSCEMLDWREVAGVAIDTVGAAEAHAAVPSAVTEEFASHIQEVVPAVADFTGLVPQAPLAQPVIFNRAEWIVTTAQTMGELMEPFLREMMDSERVAGRLMKTAARAEMGLVLGYLSRRVLGQYDISLIDPDSRDGRLFFVYPNIVDTEERLGVDGDEFRRWLALHEMTHVFEFQANPWLRRYITDLIQGQLAFLKDRLNDTEKKRGGTKRSPGGGMLVFSGAWRELMSVDENPILAKTQALMSVLEGYSEFVMEKAGESLRGETNVAELFDHARRTKHIGHKLIEKLIGLNVKIEQYKLGYQFINHVALATDIEFVNRVWEGPKSLPTLTELQRPELWMGRMLKG